MQTAVNEKLSQAIRLARKQQRRGLYPNQRKRLLALQEEMTSQECAILRGHLTARQINYFMMRKQNNETGSHQRHTQQTQPTQTT